MSENAARPTGSTTQGEQASTLPGPAPATTTPDDTTLPEGAVRHSLLPEQFGRYHIIRLLGRGGMGTVYLAHDTVLDRPVALKVPHPELAADVQAVERFYREARTAGRLNHPNVCPVHDVGEIGGKHYLTMAYIDGRPLSACVADYPGRARQAAELVRKLALALERAHAHDVIHRDLKPSNIMLTPEGEPVVMDFGLARLARKEGGPSFSSTGHIVGTPAYMPPEQALGDHEAVGPASDLYSLGVILYELLTGQTPFEGNTAALLVQVVHNAPPPPRTLRADIEPRLEAICLKALAKKPADRFARMHDFAEALSGFLAASPASPQTPITGAGDEQVEGLETALRLLRTWGWEQGLTNLKKERLPGVADEARPLLMEWLAGDAQRHDEALERFRGAAALSPLSGWALLGQAFVAVRTWGLDRAEALIERAEAAAGPQDNALAGSLSNLRGFLHSLRGQDEQAWPLLHQALTVLGRDHFLVGHVLDTLGWVYASMDNFLAAREFHRQSLLRWQRFGHEPGEGLSRMQLGWIDLEWGRLDEAEGHLTASLRIFQKARDDYRQAKVFGYLGRVALARGERDLVAGKKAAARKQWAQAGEWLELSIQRHQARHSVLVGRARIDRALVHLAEGDLALAEEQLRIVEELLRDTGSAFHNALRLRALARLRAAQDRTDEAAQALQQALDLFDRQRQRAEATRTQLELARVLQAAGAQRRLVAQAFLDALERGEACRRDALVRAAEEELKTVDEEAHWRHVCRRTRGQGVPEETNSLSTGEIEPVTILFLNLRGFVSYCQGLDPEELAMTLNQMMADLESTLERQRGVISSLLGGGFMALFRGTSHAERAVQAALDLLREMDEFNRPRELLGLRVLPAEIGLASGPVFLGNIGTYRNMRYTAVGAAVNLASRLMRQCVAGLPCLSRETYEMVRDRFTFREGSPRGVDLPGIGRREVWDVTGRNKNLSSGFSDF